MALNNNFDETVSALFKGIDGFVSSKTVVGEAITAGDAIIIPLVDISFGMGAGSFAQDKKGNAGGGLGGKIQPTAVLVIKDGSTKMISVKNQDVATKIVDMIPDLIDKFHDKNKEPKVDLDNLIDDAKKEQQ